MIINSNGLDIVNFKDKKVFISQPMKGKTEEQIKMERQNLVDIITKAGGSVIDSVFHDFDEEKYRKVPLVYLSRSIDLLATADIAIFMVGWKYARGCRIEYECCKDYEIDTVEI